MQEKLEKTYETVLTLSSLAVASIQLRVMCSMLSRQLDFDNTPSLTPFVVLLLLFQFAPLMIAGRNQGWYPDRKESVRIFRKDPLLLPFSAVYLALNLFILVLMMGPPLGLAAVRMPILWAIVLFIEGVYVLVFGYTFSRIFRKRHPAVKDD